jgi:sec-independent protein translocase protein TatB
MMPKSLLKATYHELMFSVPHLVIIFIVVLVVFGPHKLPELARSLGKMMAEFRKASTDFKMAFEEEMRNIERQAREAEWKKSQQAAAIANTEQQATLGAPADATPAEPETSHILADSTRSIEPKITPVSEAVARESQPLVDPLADPNLATDSELATTHELPVTEGTPPSNSSASENADAQSGSPAPGELPAHDQRQPA